VPPVDVPPVELSSERKTAKSMKTDILGPKMLQQHIKQRGLSQDFSLFFRLDNVKRQPQKRRLLPP